MIKATGKDYIMFIFLYLMIAFIMGAYIHIRESACFLEYINPRLWIKNFLICLLWPIMITIVLAGWVFKD